MNREIKSVPFSKEALEEEVEKNERKMRALYRLSYKDGDHGAWDDDIDRIHRYARRFGAKIEERKFNV